MSSESSAIIPFDPQNAAFRSALAFQRAQAASEPNVLPHESGVNLASLISSLSQALSTSNDMTRGLTERVSDLQSDKAILSKDGRNLSGQLTTLQKAFEAAEARVLCATKEKERISEEEEKNRVLIEFLRQEYEKYNEDNKALKDGLIGAQEDRIGLTGKVDSFNKEVKDLKVDKENLKSEVNELQQQILKLSSEQKQKLIEKVNDELMALASRHESLKKYKKITVGCLVGGILLSIPIGFINAKVIKLIITQEPSDTLHDQFLDYAFSLSAIHTTLSSTIILAITLRIINSKLREVEKEQWIFENSSPEVAVDLKLKEAALKKYDESKKK